MGKSKFFICSTGLPGCPSSLENQHTYHWRCFDVLLLQRCPPVRCAAAAGSVRRGRGRGVVCPAGGRSGSVCPWRRSSSAWGCSGALRGMALHNRNTTPAISDGIEGALISLSILYNKDWLLYLKNIYIFFWLAIYHFFLYICIANVLSKPRLPYFNFCLRSHIIYIIDLVPNICSAVFETYVV